MTPRKAAALGDSIEVACAVGRIQPTDTAPIKITVAGIQACTIALRCSADASTP
jgi:hypothetical protein